MHGSSRQYPYMHNNIICIVAKGSGCGKTYVMERLIAELKRRGRRVSAIKHSAHFHNPDKQDKDTYKYASKGADRIILFSDEGMLFYELKQPDIEHLSDLASTGMDIVLVEGFKDGPFKKIEVFNKSLYNTPVCVEPNRTDYIAIVSDDTVETDIPCFSFDDIQGICSLIENRAGL